MHDVIIARALHVISVVIWIGGLSMVTTVALPAVRGGALGPDPMPAFRAIERRFAWQARTAVLLAGLSGLYMSWRLDLWGRFRSAGFWWMHAMVCLWLLFSLMLFVVEPLVVRRQRMRPDAPRPGTALKWLQRGHWLLLLLSMITVLGAVAGSQGWAIF
jgi:uncharacterized membrane protein